MFRAWSIRKAVLALVAVTAAVAFLGLRANDMLDPEFLSAVIMESQPDTAPPNSRMQVMRMVEDAVAALNNAAEIAPSLDVRKSLATVEAARMIGTASGQSSPDLTKAESLAQGGPELAIDSSHAALCKVVETAAVSHGLPTDFLSRLLWQESSFRVDAVSPVGALGIAQFMPVTAAERGLADPLDPGQAIPASADFLSDLVERFGNLGLAAAAYNAGPRRVWEWLSGTGGMPEETRSYVAKITGLPVEYWRDQLPLAHEEGQPERPRLTPCTQVIAELASPLPAGEPVEPDADPHAGSELEMADAHDYDREARKLVGDAGEKEEPAAAEQEGQTPTVTSAQSAAAPNRPVGETAMSVEMRPAEQLTSSSALMREPVSEPEPVAESVVSPEPADPPAEQSAAVPGGNSEFDQSGADEALRTNPEPSPPELAAIPPQPEMPAPGSNEAASSPKPWGVQLVANPSEAAALASYRDLQKVHPDVLGSEEPLILRKPNPGMGAREVVNIRVAAESRADADELCRKLQEEGGACAVLKSSLQTWKPRSCEPGQCTRSMLRHGMPSAGAACSRRPGSTACSRGPLPVTPSSMSAAARESRLPATSSNRIAASAG